MIIISRHETEAEAIEAAGALGADHRVEKTTYVTDRWVVARNVKPGDYLNHHGYSDAHPYQVIRVTPSGKTAYVRGVKAELDPTWKPDMHVGGFSAHTANNGSQRWIYGEQTGNEFAVRLCKNGWQSKIGRHGHSDEPRRFHDYNF
jgi:hypothetical protein